MQTLAFNCCVLVFFASLSKMAFSSFSLNHPIDDKSLREHIFYIEDKTGDLTIDAIISSEENLKFTKADSAAPNFGLSPSTFWFKLALEMPPSHAHDWVLEIANPLLRYVDFYLVHDRELVKTYSAGSRRPYSSRPVESRHFVFPMELKDYQNATIYLKVKADDGTLVPFSVLEKEDHQRKKFNEMFILGFYFGVMAVMSLYNLFLFASTRDKSYLYYVAYVSSLSFIQLGLTGLLQQYIFPGLPQVAERVYLFFVSATVVFAALFTIDFLSLKSKSGLFDGYLRLVAATAACLSIWGLVDPSDPLHHLNLSSILLVVLGSFSAGLWLWHKKSHDARYYVISWIFMFAGSGIMTCTKLGFLPLNVFTENSLLIGSLSEVVLLSFALANKLNILKLSVETKNKEIVFLNRNLEKIVETKTKAIMSLLDHVPQGILSLDAHLKITRDFSAHLVQILETHQIAERSFKAIILDHCELDSDGKDQAWQALHASIGQAPLNFEINLDKLPSELIYKVGDKRKYLKATWNIEVERDIIVRILITLLDITSEKILEREAEGQQQELTKIMELANVSHEKVRRFLSTSLPLVHENQRLLKDLGDKLSLKHVTILFVNVHTVKGAARTLQFKELAVALHEAEDHYAKILKYGEPILPHRLLSDIENVIRIFELYIDINHSKLNRVASHANIPIERQFIESHYYTVRRALNEDPAISFAETMNVLRRQCQMLADRIFDCLPRAFEIYKEKSEKIAKDIGKARPVCDFDIADVEISPEKTIVIDNCMIHLLRNCLDHGLENPIERRRKGKGESGRITVKATLLGHVLTIMISDDGKGLDIENLRRKGLEQGLLGPDCSLTEIADLVFTSGLSTAEEVSDISGRGMGMTAVRSFLEKENGHIGIVLGNRKEDGFFNFKFEIVLPLLNARNLENLQAVG